MKNHSLKSLFICLNLTTILTISQGQEKGSDHYIWKSGINTATINDPIRKVISAMLSMQRKAWETGIASNDLTK